MKIAMMTLLILSSCKLRFPRPQIEPQERCVVSLKFNKCRCIKFDLYNWKTIGKGYDREIEHCDDLIGFSIEDWATRISPWAKENIRLYEDNKR
jgi:hypothetical protein